MKDIFDNQIEGQMSIDDLFEPPERLFAVSRIFARARKEMSLAEQKTFVYALSKMKFTEEATTDVVYLEKTTLAEICGLSVDTNHLSRYLHELIKDLTTHSTVHFLKEDHGFYDDGQIITRVTMYRSKVRVKFERDYLPLFTGLSNDYITMWSADIFQMKYRRSVQFYEFLRQNTDTRLDENSVGLGVKALKDMFEIPKEGEGSYTRKDGCFDRTAFEKRVIQLLCDDLKGCKMIVLQPHTDGKMYEKVRKSGRVLGYRFRWKFNASPRPGISTEKKEQAEEPSAKKLTGGKGKQTSGKRNNTFNDFEQRDYDFDSLESQLLRGNKRAED